jgi:hypothetical protein
MMRNCLRKWNGPYRYPAPVLLALAYVLFSGLVDLACPAPPLEAARAIPYRLIDHRPLVAEGPGRYRTTEAFYTVDGLSIVVVPGTPYDMRLRESVGKRVSIVLEVQP